VNPVDFFTGLALDFNTDIILWVAAGITAAMALVFVLLGVRKGLSWFFALIAERRDFASYTATLNSEYDRQRDYESWTRDFNDYVDAYGVAGAGAYADKEFFQRHGRDFREPDEV